MSRRIRRAGEKDERREESAFDGISPEEGRSEDEFSEEEIDRYCRQAEAEEKKDRAAGRSEEDVPYTTADSGGKDDAVKVYLREMGRIPIMTPEEERETAEKARRGDPASIKRMIEANLRLVV